jgi:protein O-mannosyl-transferase
MMKNIKNFNSVGKPRKINKQTKTEKSGNRMDNMINRYFNIIAFILIAIAGIVVYSNSLDCSFHFDDRLSIIENPLITNLSNFANLNYWLHPGRQIAYLSFALNYHFNHNNVLGYHLINIIFHIITGIFSFLLIKLLLNLNNSKHIKFDKYKNWLALFSALFFVVHPLQTQAITYIVQRMASMAAMFYIISIYLYAVGRIEHTQKNKITRAIIFYIFALISGFLAVMTKENAATFPFAMLLFEFCFIRNKENKIFKNYIIYSFSGFVIICIIYLLINPSIFTTDATHGISISSMDYLINQFVIIVRYLQLTLLPINQCADYGDFALHFPYILTFWDLKVIGSFLLLSALFVLAIYLYKKNRALSFGLFWFFLTLSIESSIIPIADPMFEHRMYLPMLGIGLFLINSLFLIFNKIKPIYIFTFLSVLIVVLGNSCYSRNKIWKTDLSLWTDVIKNAPYNARGYNNRGLAKKNLGDKEGALQDYNRAIEITPEYSLAYNNRGNLKEKLGDREGALIDYNRTIEIKPDYAEAYNNRGILYHNLNDNEGSLKDLNRAIELKPDYPDALNNRGNLKTELNDNDGAILDYNRAIELNPDYAEAYNGIGSCYFSIKDYNKAISSFEKAIKLNPGMIVAKKNLEIAKSLIDSINNNDIQKHK